MIEDELLKWKFKQGSTEALSCIYQKYLDDLLTLAVGLLNDPNEAEDVVQDVFVSFAKSAKTFKLRGSLKAYLATSVINRVRDRIRKKRTRSLEPDRLKADTDLHGPDQSLIYSEQWQRLVRMLDELERVLKPGGYLFVADIRRSWVGLLDKVFKSALTLDEAKALFRKSKLRDGVFSSALLWWRFEA